MLDAGEKSLGFDIAAMTALPPVAETETTGDVALRPYRSGPS
jgi:hypothetical protein